MTITSEAAAGYVVLTGNIEPEEDGFNAYCPELGVATCGDTVEEVLDGLQDALAVYIAGLAEIGELERVFAEREIAIHSGPLPAEQVMVSVPVGATVRAYVQAVPAPVAVAV